MDFADQLGDHQLNKAAINTVKLIESNKYVRDTDGGFLWNPKKLAWQIPCGNYGDYKHIMVNGRASKLDLFESNLFLKFLEEQRNNWTMKAMRSINQKAVRYGNFNIHKAYKENKLTKWVVHAFDDIDEYELTQSNVRLARMIKQMQGIRRAHGERRSMGVEDVAGGRMRADLASKVAADKVLNDMMDVEEANYQQYLAARALEPAVVPQALVVPATLGRKRQADVELPRDRERMRISRKRGNQWAEEAAVAEKTARASAQRSLATDVRDARAVAKAEKNWLKGRKADRVIAVRPHQPVHKVDAEVRRQQRRANEAAIAESRAMHEAEQKAIEEEVARKKRPRDDEVVDVDAIPDNVVREVPRLEFGRAADPRRQNMNWLRTRTDDSTNNIRNHVMTLVNEEMEDEPVDRRMMEYNRRMNLLLIERDDQPYPENGLFAQNWAGVVDSDRKG